MSLALPAARLSNSESNEGRNWSLSWIIIAFTDLPPAPLKLRPYGAIEMRLLHCALSLVAQCIVIGPVCGVFVCVFVCLWVCYHDDSKLRASILTKLGLQVKVVTICSWLNFGRHVPPGRGSAAGRKFLPTPYYSQRAVFASPWALFSLLLF